MFFLRGGRPHPRLSTAAVRHERTVHIRLFLLLNFPRTLLSVRTLSNRQMCATPCHWFSSSHLMVSTCGTLNPLRHSFAWYGLPQGGQANPLRKYADPHRLHLYGNSLVKTWNQSIAILMQPHASFSCFYRHALMHCANKNKPCRSRQRGTSKGRRAVFFVRCSNVCLIRANGSSLMCRDYTLMKYHWHTRFLR